MKNLRRNPFFYLSLVLAFAVIYEVAGVVEAQVATWTAPAVGPTGGNPAQPLDTSSLPQTKSGGLTIATSAYVYGIKLAPGGNLVFGQVSGSGITPQAAIAIQNGVLSYTNDMQNWQAIGSGTGNSNATFNPSQVTNAGSVASAGYLQVPIGGMNYLIPLYVTSSTGNLNGNYLYGNIHTQQDCINAGGTPYLDYADTTGSNPSLNNWICKMNYATSTPDAKTGCPSGWRPYIRPGQSLELTATKATPANNCSPAMASIDTCTANANTCPTDYHSFSLSPIESCVYPTNPPVCNQATCYATITQIGCY